MSTAGSGQTVEALILEVLRETGRDLTPEEVEAALTERSGQKIGTLEVREAIWRLIVAKSAVLTPRRTIRAPDAPAA